MSKDNTAAPKKEKDERSLVQKFFSLNGASVFVAMIIVCILLELILQLQGKGDGGLVFITPSNFLAIFRQQVYVGIIAFALTLVIITGNIDLSVGYQLTFLCCVCGWVMVNYDNTLFAVALTLLAGVGCGLLNGILVGGLKLNSFVTTLGTSSIFSALAILVSAGTVLVIPSDCQESFQLLGQASIGGVSILVFWFILVAVVLSLLLSRTVYGQQLYMIGANPVAARYSGIRSGRNIAIAYTIVGLVCGLAAIITMSNVQSANPQSASGKEMEVILCVVLGGTAVNGGKGSGWATIIGVLFYGVLSAGFTMLGLNDQLSMIAMGIIMVIVLAMDALRGRGVKLWKKK